MEILKKSFILISFIFATSIFVFGSKKINDFLDSENSVAKKLISKNGQVAKAFFSPDDHITDILEDLIKSEQEKICATIFTLTEPRIANALKQACERNVSVEIVVDKGYANDRFSKVPTLYNTKIYLMQFNPLTQTKISNPLMHNKFFLFYKNINDLKLIWTGSFNCTKSANFYNQENVVILSNEKIIKKFERNFQLLKSRCIKICSNETENIKPEKNLPKNETYADYFYRILRAVAKVI